MLSQPAEAKTFEPTVDDRLICLSETQKNEKTFHIKEHLLTTIANVESGRWDKDRQQTLAWPWTVNANGKGMQFKTKAEAVEAVRKLQAKGMKSIDVGCMQINLSYHGGVFKNLEEAFDPARNVAYGAKFLKELYARKGNWTEAAMAYHSSVSEKALRYKQKIELAFENTKKMPWVQPSPQPEPDNEFFAAKPLNDRIKTAKTRASAIASDSANEWREAKLAEYRLKKGR
jgi:hypothetical protein